ncbi:MAG: hypothetical protein ABIS21_07405 [Acidimicrobiales bacterium]
MLGSDPPLSFVRLLDRSRLSSTLFHRSLFLVDVALGLELTVTRRPAHPLLHLADRPLHPRARPLFA